MSLINKKLLDLCDGQTLVEIHRDSVSEDTVLGVIARVGQSLLLVRRLDAIGRPDGVSILLKSDITRLKWGGRELESNSMLLSHDWLAAGPPDIDLSDHRSAIRGLADTFGYVGCYAELLGDGLYFVGELVELSEGVVHLSAYGTYKGRDRSNVVLRLTDITRMDAGGAYEERLKILCAR